jgi:hypothetical protein
MPEKRVLDDDTLRKSVGLKIKEFDEELKGLELTAIKKLELSGIHSSKIQKDDSYIVTTILAYVKGNFRFTEANLAIRFQQVFEDNKNFMRSTIEYTQESSDKNG